MIPEVFVRGRIASTGLEVQGMRQAVIAIIGSVIVVGGPAEAALSGYWDSSRIIHSILGRNDVADALRQQPVESITRTDSGYTIKSKNCTVDVIVTRVPPNKPGRTGFQAKVGKGHCQ